MGIKGAAIATVLSQVLSLIFVVYTLSNPKDLIHLQRGIYGLKKNIVKHILTIGLSPFCMQLCACLVVILINKGLTRHGGDLARAADGIVNSVTFMFIMVVLGICQGMQPIAGFNYGAKQMDRVNQVLWKAITMSTIVMCTSFILCEFFPQLPIGLFTDDAELMKLSEDGMRLIVCMSPVVGFQIVVGNFFQSIGMPKQSIFLSVSRQLVFLCPFLLIFPQIWGTNGVWISITTEDGLASISSGIMLWLFYRNKKTAKDVSEIHARSLKHRIAYFFHNRVTP